MNMKTKRIIALVMAAVTILGLLAGISFSAGAATVDYIYASGTIKNWGTRGTTATFLSPKAEEFYADNNTSYTELAKLSGSATTSSVPSSALYKELQELMRSNHSYQTSYNGTKDLYQYTDCQNSGKTSSRISSFYSGTAIGPAWDGGSTWNREHTWPNSKGLGGNDENDIMMLRPTSKSENSSRGNTAYGESSNYYDPNNESGGKHNLHGDVARIMLYTYVRWGNTSYMWGQSGVMESKAVLLKWMEEDPVDTWELGRNDSVESITGTRNVFVDYPELAFLLFNAQVPADYETPSGSASGSTYSITAVSSNTAWGKVSVSGSTINASPAAGYEVSGYKLLSGTAEITRTGNAFLVTPSSDVKVQILFAARSQKTVQFVQPEGVVSSETAYSGDMITLPGHAGEVQTGHTFMGWVENPMEETTTIPTFYTEGSRYTVTENGMLYALYARSESGGTGISNVFSPYSGELTEGDYIIVYEDSAMVAELTDKNRLQFTGVTYTAGDIVAPAASIVWHIAPSGSYWTMYNTAASKYAGGTGVKNVAGLLGSVTDFAKWTSQMASGNTYEFINKGNDDKAVNSLLRKNGSVGFACYAKNTTVGGALSLYKRISGTVLYFTGAAVCGHPDAYQEQEKAPTCTQAGYTAGVYCPDCEEYISGHEVLPATGHSYVDGICSGCGVSEDGTVVPQLKGDVDSNGVVNEDDAIYLLQHVLMPGVFPLSADADFDGSGAVNEDDAIYLLQHVLMPGVFPLK